MGGREVDRSLEPWALGAKDVQRRMIPATRVRVRWYTILLLAQAWTAAAPAEMLERDPTPKAGGHRPLVFEQTGDPQELAQVA